MVEVYTNSYSNVDLEIYDSSGRLSDPVGDVSVEIYDYDVYNEETKTLGKVIKTGTASQLYYGDSKAEGRFIYELTPEITDIPRNLRIKWTFFLDQNQLNERSGTKEIFINIPYVTLGKLREIKELNEYSDQEIMSMERMVSRIIDSYCGQSFSFEINKTKTIPGASSEYLILPGRLWHLEDIKVLDDYVKIIRDGQGNVVEIDQSGRSIIDYVTVDIDNPWRIRNRKSYNFVPLDETRSSDFFRNGNIYAITGNWGYPFVPARVSQAASILIKTYFYDDSAYRDRYVSEIMAGNWRMKFSATGDSTTGSANADIILSAFRDINVAVL